MGVPGQCNLGPPKGELRKHYAKLVPPWDFCKQGPTCVYDHAKWGPKNMKEALKKRDEEFGGSSGQGPGGMDTEGYIRITNIRLNNYNDHALTNLPTSPQVGTGGSRVRREHDTERMPSCERGLLPYNNTSCPSKRRGMSDNTKDKSRIHRNIHSMPAYSTYTPGMKRGGIKMKITQHDNTFIQERTAPEMRRRRCIRLRPRMWNIQRLSLIHISEPTRPLYI